MKKILLIVGGVVVVAGLVFGYYKFFNTKESPYLWTEAALGDIREVVSETGIAERLRLIQKVPMRPITIDDAKAIASSKREQLIIAVYYKKNRKKLFLDPDFEKLIKSSEFEDFELNETEWKNFLKNKISPYKQK